MDIEQVRDALLWCVIINYGILLVWFLIFMAAHDWLYSSHAKLFHLSVEKFNALNYIGMMIFKIGIILFYLVPYIVFRVLG